eukprot:SAG11_NODE_2462_length_3327_cov_2.195167_5_plen_149_part_00
MPDTIATIPTALRRGHWILIKEMHCTSCSRSIAIKASESRKTSRAPPPDIVAKQRIGQRLRVPIVNGTWLTTMVTADPGLTKDQYARGPNLEVGDADGSKSAVQPLQPHERNFKHLSRLRPHQRHQRHQKPRVPAVNGCSRRRNAQRS